MNHLIWLKIELQTAMFLNYNNVLLFMPWKLTMLNILLLGIRINTFCTIDAQAVSWYRPIGR